MALRQHLRSRAVLVLLASTTGLWWVVSGCGTQNPTGASPLGSGGAPDNSGGAAASPAAGGTAASSAGGSAGGSATGGTGADSTGGAATGGATVACTPEATTEITHTAGNYDNMSCNKANCHTGEIGGWLYASAKGYPWVAGGTVTITNNDGTTLTAVSGEDGFFDFGIDPRISSPYEVCASKCPSADCNLTTHTSTDCLSSGCHALPTQRIFVTTPDAGGTGGSGTVPGENCAQPTPGGPYVHAEAVFSATSNQPCVNCHMSPTYAGGFLYDDAAGTTTIAEATVTLTPASGSAVTAVTGPDGMFFFGTVGLTTTAQAIPTPYTACVSKCPIAAVCSLTNQHTTNADCGTCHDTYTTGKVYLK